MVTMPAASSWRLDFPMITAPASRSFLTTVASAVGTLPASAIEAPVVARPFVSKLSLRMIGMPCSGPRTLPRRRSASMRAASARAAGLSRIIALSAGPSFS
jgi:hypothetical protein